MLNGIGLSVMFASAFLITVADVLIKKVSTSAHFFDVVFNPWMITICVLYFLQILLAVYIFIHHGDLAVYGNLYIVFYSIMMVVGGAVLFQEHITLLQILGVCCALIGGLLINGYRFGM